MSILSENISKYTTNYKFIQEIKMGKPVDFSFRGIRTLYNLKNDIPRVYRLRGAPERGQNKKYKSAAIWLNHNNLSNLNNLKKIVYNQLELPMYLTWLDISHNELKNIDQEILNFKHLKILYIHGNYIEDVEEVLKLKPLLQLRKLTLHGNPMSRIENYRRYVLYYLPQIQSLDFSPITVQNRSTVPPVDCIE